MDAIIVRTPCAIVASPPTCPPSCPPSQTLQQDTPQFRVQYTHVTQLRNISINITRQYHNLLCHQKPTPSVIKTLNITSSTNISREFTSLPSVQSNLTSNATLRPHKSTDHEQVTVSSDDYVPYVIGITPTYYRLTQRLDLTTLCQTLMNVPRFLWIVVEDSETPTAQVEDILTNCRVRV